MKWFLIKKSVFRERVISPTFHKSDVSLVRQISCLSDQWPSDYWDMSLVRQLLNVRSLTRFISQTCRLSDNAEHGEFRSNKLSDYWHVPVIRQNNCRSNATFRSSDKFILSDLWSKPLFRRVICPTIQCKTLKLNTVNQGNFGRFWRFLFDIFQPFFFIFSAIGRLWWQGTG